MAIDLLREQALSLARAARYAAKVLGRDSAFSAATMHRWIRKGKYGVWLESLNTPSGRVVTVEAIHRFFAAITAAARREQPVVRSSPKRSGIEERVMRAMDVLDGGRSE